MGARCQLTTPSPGRPSETRGGIDAESRDLPPRLDRRTGRVRPRPRGPARRLPGPGRTQWIGRSPSSCEDALSGGLPLAKRTTLLDALAALARGDVLLVAKRDRLSRGDMMTTAMIEAAVKRAGARIVSAAGEGTESDDPASVLMRRIVDAFGEYERLLIKARTRAALKAKKARGERYGQVPYGRPPGRRRHPPRARPGRGRRRRPHPRPARRQADPPAGHRRRARARRGIPTKSGRPWKHSTVHDVLRRVAADGQA